MIFLFSKKNLSVYLIEPVYFELYTFCSRKITTVSQKRLAKKDFWNLKPNLATIIDIYLSGRWQLVLKPDSDGSPAIKHLQVNLILNIEKDEFNVFAAVKALDDYVFFSLSKTLLKVKNVKSVIILVCVKL